MLPTDAQRKHVMAHLSTPAKSTSPNSKSLRRHRVLSRMPVVNRRYRKLRVVSDNAVVPTVRSQGQAGKETDWKSRATPTIASRLCSTSAAVVAQDETLMRIAVLPCQTVPPHQQVPSS